VIGSVVAGLAALCYAELASSVPTTGNAYTYAFATLGEVFAWIIDWDLLLEFAGRGLRLTRLVRLPGEPVWGCPRRGSVRMPR
jgi:hypothetical protein